ncbi:peroxisome biogenesis factor 1-like [Schistocerca gregaria]|uniref:peroxisome biogenesis factor 1-like n=1 Tax=Schistocerca gregaria TaxID=7010 RepID=UPI00211DFEAB|nr:peroxisome biogenesis factor 1-like [Schistocerca gregaria]
MATLGAHCFSRLRVRPERGFENWASRIPRSLYFQPVVFEEDEDLESDGSQLEVPALLRGFEAWIEANVMNGVKGASCSAKEVADELSVPVTNGLLFCLQGGSGYYRVYCDAMERIGAAEALPSESARRAGAVGDSLARSPFESLINLFGGPLDEKRGREGGGGGRANSVATERKRERPTEEWLDRVMEDTSVYFIPRNVRFDERSVVVGKKKQIRRNKELFLSYGIFPSSVLLPSLVLPRAVSCCPPPKIAEIGGLDREIERCKLHIVGALCCRRLKRRIGDSWSNCVIHIYGQRRSGKTTLSVSLAHQFALCPRYRAYPAVFSGLARCGISSDELRRELALFFEEAIAHQPSVVVFDDLDLLVSLKGEHEYAAAEDAVRAHVVSSEFAKWLRLIANARHIVCVIFTSLERFSLPRELCQPGLVSVECATPSQESRVQIFERLLARKKLTLAPSVDVSSLVSKCEGYTAADLEQYLDRALHAASVRVVDAASLGGRAVGAHNGTSNEVSNKTSNEVSNKTSNETPNEMSKTSNEMSNEMSKTSNEMSKTPNKTSSGCFLASDRQVCDSSFPRWNLALEDFDAARLGFAPASLRGLKLQESGVTWADVGGLDEICEEIRQLLEWPIKYQFLYRLVPISRCANVLLYGPSGCGKTLLAHAAAKECGLNFLSVKGPELLDKYIGQSEAGVRELFSRARNAAPCMLFFDEFDSIAPRRGHDQTGVTDRVVNQFLTELDGVESLEGVHVFAATSRPDLIDPALLRPGRLDKAYYVRPPAFSDRLAILSAVGRQLNFSDDVDFSVISSWTDGYTGADLRALLYDSQLLAIQERLDRQPAANSPQASLPLAHLLRVDVQGSDSPENQSHLLQRLETIKQKLEKRREISNFSLTNDRVNTFSETRARPTPITISMRHVKSAFSRLNPSTTPDQRKKNDLLYSSFSASKKMDASTDAQQLLLCQKVTMA